MKKISTNKSFEKINNEEYKIISKEKYFEIIRGSFHQGDLKLFNGDSAGRQCTANAAVAIVMCSIKFPELWTMHEVNSVLIAVGDQIYRQSLESRPSVDESEENSMYLNAQEVKQDISIGAHSRRIHLKGADLAVGHLYETMFGCLKLKDKLEEFLKYDGSAILTSNNISIAIGKSSSVIWMFDSHGRNRFGKSSNEKDVTACLTLFRDIHSLFELINQNIPHLFGDGDRRN